MELEYTITGEGKNWGNQPKLMERNIAEEEDGWINSHNMEKNYVKQAKIELSKIHLLNCLPHYCLRYELPMEPLLEDKNIF